MEKPVSEPETTPNADNEPPTDSQESQDISQGYDIIIHVSHDGYEVEGPMPTAPEPQGQEPQDVESSPDIREAMRHVLAIIKDNPMGEEANKQFKSGYGE